MNKDRVASEKLIRGLEKDGFKAIMLTVDAAVPGKREMDQRTKGFTAGPAHGKSGVEGGGVALAISGYQDPDVCCEWFYSWHTAWADGVHAPQGTTFRGYRASRSSR